MSLRRLLELGKTYPFAYGCVREMIQSQQLKVLYGRKKVGTLLERQVAAAKRDTGLSDPERFYQPGKVGSLQAQEPGSSGAVTMSLIENP